ncbi:DUF6297 family protein [Tessaracoccus sp. OS52]|uniref:DUF6297 family protein n=1 Tax=Tessaracoccus sp. OS52 TaxID=2886691 RepID=UPI001D0FAB7C|nr:DUF6297 family protein [Tessaracoccus sp. OS52]MCC2592134.1 DUF6297 family protein [Tessaracoccus sp. OS52]
MNVTDDRFGEVGQADEKQLKLLMRDWRHGRADRNILEALQDAYVMVFGVVLIGAMLISSIIQAQQSVAGCTTDSCLAARGLLPWAAVAAVLAFTLVACRMFGPIVASAAEGFWLMDAAVDRRRLLRGRLFAALAIAFGLGALFGALIAALTGSTLVNVGVWALSAGLGAFGLTAFAAAEQGLERHWITTALQWIVGLLAVATLLALVGIAAGWLPVEGLDRLSVEFAYLIAGGGLLLGIISAVLAHQRLRNIRRQRLTAGSSLIAGMQGAAFALDFALVRDILVEHKAKQKGHVRATRGAGVGTKALVLRDVQRLWRSPMPLVGWLGSMVVPYAVQALGISQLNPPISALVLMAVLIPFMNSLRVLTRTKGLQRCFPFSPSQIKTAVIIVPAVLALVWGIATAPAFLGVLGGERLDLFAGVTAALITAVAGLLAAIRWVSAKPADYGGPIVAVGVGAMPPGMLFSILRGIDMVALVTLPIVFGLPVWVSILIAAVAFAILRSGFDKDQMLEQQEEQRRLLEEEKARKQGRSTGNATKIKVQRSAKR